LTNTTILYGILIFFSATLILAWLSYRNKEAYNSPLKEQEKTFALKFHIFLMSCLNMVGVRRDIFSFSKVTMQIVYLIVLLTGATLTASLGGMITASFMHSVDQSKVISPEQFGKYTISTLKGSTAENFLAHHKLHNSTTPVESWISRETWHDALQDITDKKANLVVGDWVQLTYLANSQEFKDRIQVHSQVLRFEPYGWGLPRDSALRDPINQEMIGILRTDAWPRTVSSYVGTSDLQAR